MTFILVTGGIMAVSIVIIYKLANLFGLRLKYKALILCAVMALLVNIAAISLSPYLTRAHYFRLIFLVLAAAAAVTIYNERLLLKEAPAGEAPPIALQSTANKAKGPLTVLKEKLSGLFGSKEAPEKPWGDLELERAPEEDRPQESFARTLEPFKLKEESAEKEAVPSPPKVPPAPPAKKEPPPTPAAAEVVLLSPEKKPEPPKSKVIPKETPAAPLIKPFTPPVIARPKPPAPTEVKPAPTAAKPIPQPKPMALKPRPPLRLEGPEILRLSTAIRQMSSMDNIIDFAYAQKRQGRFAQAAFAYRKAIDRYRSDSYAPFLAIELGSLYKEQGAYDEAIRTYADALTIPAVADDDAMYREFLKNLSYLRSVKYILAKHNALAIPFARIPADILQEVEDYFNRTQGELKA